MQGNGLLMELPTASVQPELVPEGQLDGREAGSRNRPRAVGTPLGPVPLLYTEGPQMHR